MRRSISEGRYDELRSLGRSRLRSLFHQRYPVNEAADPAATTWQDLP